MSSIDFRDDEWGRHWSQAPILHRKLLSRPHSALAEAREWLTARMRNIRDRRLERQDRQALERMSPESLRDIFPADQVPPVRVNRLEYVRDGFGRPVI
jgi:uncharacterized protein YjiS (DUF1127 family)